MTVGRDFGGNLVTEKGRWEYHIPSSTNVQKDLRVYSKEMQDLFRGNGGAQRTPEQIISLLSRRMECMSFFSVLLRQAKLSLG